MLAHQLAGHVDAVDQKHVRTADAKTEIRTALDHVVELHHIEKRLHRAGADILAFGHGAAAARGVPHLIERAQAGMGDGRGVAEAGRAVHHLLGAPGMLEHAATLG